MNDFENTVVNLSDYPAQVSVPGHLAALLARIADAGPEGVSALRLAAEGYDSIREAMQALALLGVMIDEYRREEPLWAGAQPEGVPHFTYTGMHVSTAQHSSTMQLRDGGSK